MAAAVSSASDSCSFSSFSSFSSYCKSSSSRRSYLSLFLVFLGFDWCFSSLAPYTMSSIFLIASKLISSYFSNYCSTSSASSIFSLALFLMASIFFSYCFFNLLVRFVISCSRWWREVKSVADFLSSFYYSLVSFFSYYSVSVLSSF